MTIESIVDLNDKSQPDDEGCEYCACGLYPHEVTQEEALVWIINSGEMILWCTNDECENYHKPVGGFSA